MSFRHSFLFLTLAAQVVLPHTAHAQSSWPMPVDDPVLASLIEEAGPNPDVVPPDRPPSRPGSNRSRRFSRTPWFR
jgi:hypothetical protein